MFDESEMVSKPGPWFLVVDSYISEHFHVGASVWEIITYPSTPARGSLQDVTVEAPCLERCGDFLDVWSQRTFSHFFANFLLRKYEGNPTRIAKTDYLDFRRLLSYFCSTSFYDFAAHRWFPTTALWRALSAKLLFLFQHRSRKLFVEMDMYLITFTTLRPYLSLFNIRHGRWNQG